jgi:hypothetical protein
MRQRDNDRSRASDKNKESARDPHLQRAAHGKAAETYIIFDITSLPLQRWYFRHAAPRARIVLRWAHSVSFAFHTAMKSH